MARSVLLKLFMVYLALSGVKSKPLEDVSHIEGINFQYKNDKWTCGDVECPAPTVGCKIVMKTNRENRKELLQTFNCIDKDKGVTLGAGNKIDLSKEKTIEIDLETYVGAESAYTTGYGSGGHENAKGVIAVDKLSHLKETARRNKKLIEDLSASSN